MDAETRASRNRGLLRPSALARFWGLHPKTVNDWIRAGVLGSVKTPGAQYRVKPADVRDFCARKGLAIPPIAQSDLTRVMLAGVSAAGRKLVERALAEHRVIVACFPSALEGVIAAGRESPGVLALDASSTELSVEAAVRALRRTAGLEQAAVVIFDVPSEPQVAALLRAGATHAIVKPAKASSAPLAKLLSEIVPR